jgi:DNA mismatch repair protein MutL
MAKVQRLPEDLANQIAAGEVVERPASVVKELLENSIDAGATRIRVDVEGGGITLLRISDDGLGMDEADARLAIERHATSKIHDIDDLLKLHTFGFRGEALPSIASVSKFLLRSRTRQSAEGLELRVEAGGPPDVRPCGAAPGTTIEIRDLFYNVPARRKFLKATATESAHITDVVEAMALSSPQLTVTLARDGRVAREWLRRDTRAERARESFDGEELAELAGSRPPVDLVAILGRPERARASTSALKLFVNGRLVRDRQLHRTISQAYGSVLEPGRYPVGAVFLELPADRVDVNVHPQKAEVRFADGRAVTDAVFKILSLELGKAFGLPAVHRGFGGPPRAQPAFTPTPEQAAAGPWAWSGPPSSAASGAGSGAGSGATPAPPTAQVGSAGPLVEAATPLPPGVVPRDSGVPGDPWGFEQLMASAIASPLPPGTLPQEGVFPHGSTPAAGAGPHAADRGAQGSPLPPGTSPLPPGTSPLPPASIAAGFMPDGTREPFSNLRFIAQVRQTFLLCEGKEGLYVLDQHAAAERVTFHRLKRAYGARSVAIQPQLFPVMVEVQDEEAALVEEQHETLLAAGIDARVVGPRSVAVHGVPQILKHASAERLLRDLLAEASRGGHAAFSDAVDLALATMACHGSVRAGDRMAADEVVALLSALDTVDFAGHCPHGRPVVTQLRWAELERKVGRR